MQRGALTTTPTAPDIPVIGPARADIPSASKEERTAWTLTNSFPAP